MRFVLPLYVMGEEDRLYQTKFEDDLDETINMIENDSDLNFVSKVNKFLEKYDRMRMI